MLYFRQKKLKIENQGNLSQKLSKNEFFTLKMSKMSNFFTIWVWEFFLKSPKLGQKIVQKMKVWLWKMLKIANFSTFEFKSSQKFPNFALEISIFRLKIEN